jgi:GTPase involved in cell partitioning and DNA repair
MRWFVVFNCQRCQFLIFFFSKNPEKKSSNLNRVKAYSQELERLKDEFNRTKNQISQNFNDNESEEEFDIHFQQKQRLLDNSSVLEKTGRNLENGYRVAIGNFFQTNIKVQSTKC